MKIPWKKVAITAWEWAQILWRAKHPATPPAPPPATADEAFDRWKDGEELTGG